MCLKNEYIFKINMHVKFQLGLLKCRENKNMYILYKYMYFI